MEFHEVELNRLVFESERYVGINLLVRGLLVVENDKAILRVESASTYLEISDKDFVDRLLDHVPCYVGGKFLYSDHVSIIGHIVIGELAPTLEGILKVNLVRNGEVFTF